MITPQPGYIQDPANPNGVIKDPSIAVTPASTVATSVPPPSTTAPTIGVSNITTPPAPLAVTTPTPAPIPTVPAPTVAPVVPTPPIPAKPSATDLNTRLSNLMATATGQPSALASRIETQTQPFTQALNELQQKSKMQQAQALANQEAALKTGETTGFASREAQNVARTDAIQQLVTNANIEAMQGNISLATTHATNAVNAEFAQTTKDIQAAKQNIYDNYDSFTPSEKKRADAMLLTLDNQDKFVAQQKTDKTDIYNTGVTAATNGQNFTPTTQYPTLNTALDAITKAPTKEAALAIASATGLVKLPTAGRYIEKVNTVYNPDGSQSLVSSVFDTLKGVTVGNTGGKTAAQMNAEVSSGIPSPYSPTTQANTYTLKSGDDPAVIAKQNGTDMATLQSLNPQVTDWTKLQPGAVLNMPGTTKSTGLDFNRYGLLANTSFNPSNAIDTAAKNYLDAYIKNAGFPPNTVFGRRATGSYINDIKNRADALAVEATGNPLPNPIQLKEYNKEINQNNSILNKNTVQADTVNRNFQLVIDVMTKDGVNTKAPVINNVVNWAETLMGDPETAAYVASNKTLANEISSLLAVKNASGTTVGDKLEAAGIVPQGTSIDGQIAIVKRLQAEASNIHTALTDRNAELYKQTDPLAQDVNNPVRKSYNSLTVTDPNGGVHTFGTVEQARAFKKQANIQ